MSETIEDKIVRVIEELSSPPSSKGHDSCLLEVLNDEFVCKGFRQ